MNKTFFFFFFLYSKYDRFLYNDVHSYASSSNTAYSLISLYARDKL